jgi:hypothetical protein
MLENHLRVENWRTPTAIEHSSTGSVVHPFASRHEGPGFNPQGATYLDPGFSW